MQLKESLKLLSFIAPPKQLTCLTLMLSILTPHCHRYNKKNKKNYVSKTTL